MTAGAGSASSPVTPRRSRSRVLLLLALLLLALLYGLDSSAQRREQAGDLMHSVANRLSGGQAPTVALERTVAAAHLDLQQPGGVPTTKILAHSPGFTVLDNLFVWNATMYIISDTQDELPPLVQINKGPGERPVDYIQADPYTIQVIPSAQAVNVMGKRATHIRGVSFIWKDILVQDSTKMLLESLLGSWKIYAHAVAPDGTHNLPFPDRIIHPLLSENEWRDRASLNSFIIKAAFPAVTAAYALDWSERAQFGFADVYDRVVLFDRRAAQGTLASISSKQKDGLPSSNTPIISGVAALDTHPDFWLAVRDSLLQSAPPDSLPPSTRPVITYISRQSAKLRRLADSDHEALVNALQELDDRFEVHIAEMTLLHRHDQINLAARTNFLISAHGDALTHLLWLPHRSTVIEILPPQAWSRQFLLPAAVVGHSYFGIWDHTVVTEEGLTGSPASKAADFEVEVIPAKAAPIVHIIEDLFAGRPAPTHLTSFADRR